MRLPLPAAATHIALSRLALCLEDECRATFDLRHTSCPRCGSRTVATLAKWLDREKG